MKSFRMKRIFGLRIWRGETQYSHQRHVVLHDCATWDALWVQFGTARICNVLFLQSLRRLLFLVKVSLKCLPSTLQADS